MHRVYYGVQKLWQVLMGTAKIAEDDNIVAFDCL